jgi:hypothetical protein
VNKHKYDNNNNNNLSGEELLTSSQCSGFHFNSVLPEDGQVGPKHAAAFLIHMLLTLKHFK